MQRGGAPWGVCRQLSILVWLAITVARAYAQTISFEPARSFGIDTPGGQTPEYNFFRSLSGDWNGDGNIDIAVVSANRVAIFAGDGTGNFQFAAELETKALVVAAADVNSDGKTDLIVLQPWNDALSAGDQALVVYLSDGQFSFSPPLLVRPRGRPWNDFKVADINHDGKPDLIVFPNGLFTSILSGNGDGTFTDPQTTPAFWSLFVAIDDFDGDRLPDLMFSDWSGKLQILKIHDDGTFSQEPVFADGVNTGNPGAWCPSGFADVDGDHRTDIWVGGDGIFCRGLWAYRASGPAQFESLPAISADFTLSPVAASTLFADFNQDGIPDLINLPNIFAGDGKAGYTQAASLPDMPAYGYALVLDVNGDQRPDLVVTGGQPRFQVFLNNTPETQGK